MRRVAGPHCWGIALALAVVPSLASAEGDRPLEPERPMGIPSAVSLVAPEAIPQTRDSAHLRMRGRMTPEERRSLREDISDAGRRLYVERLPVSSGGVPAQAKVRGDVPGGQNGPR